MRRPLLWICACLFGLILLWSVLIDAPPWQSDILKALEGKKVILTGQVYQKENRTLYGEPVLVLYLKSVTVSENISNNLSEHFSKEKTADQNAGNNQIKDRILVRIPLSALQEQGQPALGCTVKLSGRFSLFSYARNPGEFDEGLYYGIQHIAGTLKNPVLLTQNDNRWILRESVYRWKIGLLERLYRAFPEREGHVLAKMMLGEKDGLDPELKRLYQENGIAHILAISGLHISMLGMGIYHLLRKLTCPQKAAALAGGMIILIYGGMTGFGISAIRAVGMYLIHMLGEIWGKTYDMLTAMGVLAFCMVAFDPRLIYHSGFLLSFGSVLAMGMVLPVLKLLEKGEKKRKGRIKDMFLASLAVTLTTLPIQLVYFYQTSLYSVFLNLLILPLMSLVIGGGMLGMLVGRMSFLTVPVVWILRWYEIVCRKAEKLPLHLLRTGRPGAWQVVAYYGLLLLLLVLIMAGNSNRGSFQTIAHKKWLSGIGLWMIPVALMVLVLPMQHDTDVITFLDVGQGDAILLQQDGKVYLFDLGSSSRRSVGERVLIPYMKYYGLTRIEAVFLSHEDIDHCNGIMDLLQSEDITVGTVYLPYPYKSRLEPQKGSRKEEHTVTGTSSFDAIYEQALARGCRVQFIKAGDRLTSGKIKEHEPEGDEKPDHSLQILCLHPPGDYRAEHNEQSACYYILMGNISILLTGDVEKEGEELLIKALQKRGIDQINVLKVAHHGSATSTSEALLRQIKPDLAVISCGIQNQYGHPHMETLERLQTAKTTVFRTDLSGAVFIELKDGKVRVREYCGGEG